MRRRRAVLLGPLVALAAATPAAAADVEVQGLDTLVWDKPQVSILPGDTVHWKFAGTTQAHNVMSGGGNWTFASPLGAPAPDASFKFDAVGTYRFVCQVHPDTMVGDVIVGDAPPPPPPPPGQQPFPNDSTPASVLETGGLDTTRPTLRSVRVQRMKRGAKISFRVSEQSVVTVRFKRGGKVVKTTKLNASGNYRGTFRDRKRLRAGRYRVELRAEDVAGNRSSMRTAGVTIRRR
jgi:plastocyanin